MPILNVQIMQGHSAAQKTALLKAASQAVVESIAAPLSSVRIVLQEIPAEHVIVAGEIGKAMARVEGGGRGGGRGRGAGGGGGPRAGGRGGGFCRKKRTPSPTG
ncbi:tautomerase family protein, partial [Achromobacter xylosoxidans]|uniref:tautomerase family protein n=1 Tax=Alcaligenes xylosoxydans xylosoxydans TaxID=85698 RepID=UPI00236838E0